MEFGTIFMKKIEYWWSYDTHKIGSILAILAVFWDRSRSFRISDSKNRSPGAPVTAFPDLPPFLSARSLSSIAIPSPPTASRLPHRTPHTAHPPQLQQPWSFQITTTTASIAIIAIAIAIDRLHHHRNQPRLHQPPKWTISSPAVSKFRVKAEGG